MKESNPIADVPLSPLVSPTPAVAKKKRGFATMNPEQVQEFARRGGAAAHRLGTAHEFSSVEARAAGRKGGAATHSRTRSPLAE